MRRAALQGAGRDGLRSTTAQPVVLLAVLAVALLAACGGGETAPQAPPAQEPSAPAETERAAETGPPAETTAEESAELTLPRAVVRTRDAVSAAARAFDYEALAALLDPDTFSYSFGESGDPIGYWRRLEEESEVPILGDILPVVLSMHVGIQDGVYVWPAAHAKRPSAWTEEDLADMRQLYTDEEIRGFEELGGYAGYRAGIREDGTWLFFVAGD